MKYAYYPGCSLESTAREFDLSARAACAAMGVELAELEDWNCCGATSAHSTSRLLSLALPARNLGLAVKAGLDVAVPCSACYSRLKTADYEMRRDQTTRRQVEEAVGIDYKSPVNVYSLLEAVALKANLDTVAGKVVRPLSGLRAACYYGCLMVRPPSVTCFDDPENPVLMDQLVAALGASAVQWSYKTDCCGASLSLSESGPVAGMVGIILEMAREAGANAIVAACPLCQANLEMRRGADCEMPVFYFTELMGLAFGLPDCGGWFQKHLVNPLPLLASLGLF